MLKKCLKYDFRSVMRLWWIIAVSMVGASILSGLGIRFFTQCMMQDDLSVGLSLLSIFTFFISVLLILALAAGTTVSFILVFWRMYTHFYSDEGYLTFTLPVKRSTLYLSKVIMGTILQAATVVILILGVAFIMLVAVPTTDGSLLDTSIYQEMADAFGLPALVESAGWWLALWVPLALVIALLMGLWGNGLIYLCITIGAVIAKKLKLLAAIGIYYLVSSIVSVVGQIGTMFLSAGISGIFTAAAESGGSVLNLTITTVMLIVALLLACMVTIVHFITVNKIETKLNLA